MFFSLFGWTPETSCMPLSIPNTFDSHFATEPNSVKFPNPSGRSYLYRREFFFSGSLCNNAQDLKLESMKTRIEAKQLKTSRFKCIQDLWSPKPRKFSAKSHTGKSSYAWEHRFDIICDQLKCPWLHDCKRARKGGPRLAQPDIRYICMSSSGGIRAAKRCITNWMRLESRFCRYLAMASYAWSWALLDSRDL